jgi:diacylglycerol kinase (ATP)
MRAAAILGPGNFSKWVAKFRRVTDAEWSSDLSLPIDAAVIFGGDGTIHRHLPTLVDLKLPVLVVPCGSGNDFARALKLRSVHDSLDAWRTFVTGGRNVRDISLGVIQEVKPDETSVPHDHYFCCVAGVGIDTEIVRRANALPKWVRSHGGYALSAPREFLRFAPFPMKISCDEATTSSFQPTILAAFGNTPTYGGGMKIAPQAQLDDGKLDVCIVRDMDRFKLFCLFPTVYFGRHLTFKEVEYAQAETAKLETEYPLDVYADGEYVCQTPVEFSVARDALKVIVPE